MKADKPYLLGVMQGRLLPKYKGRYQAHPVGYWQEEFRIASKLGLDLIEIILDFNDAENNPLLNDDGLGEILDMTARTGVGVKSVCADYFMEAPLHVSSESAADESVQVLEKLIQNASFLSIENIVIPCVDNSSLKNEDDKLRFIDRINGFRDLALESEVKLSLETDLDPKSFSQLLDRLAPEVFTVNYDTGNSASLGFDPIEELNAYGNRISDIHIKDRVKGGGSVELGKGDANFDGFFSKLAEMDYRGPFIMQAYRDDEGLEIFKKQLAWVRPKLDRWAEENKKKKSSKGK